MSEFTINIHGKLLSLSKPVVMGILNCTPDSFFAGSRKQSEAEIADRANEIINDGGKIIDVGAYSTRPGAKEVSEEEEMRRLRFALPIVRREQPDAPLSIDTFRPKVAQMAVEEYGADIINDVSEGADKDMFPMMGRLKVPYILMSLDSNIHDMMIAFAKEIQQLRDNGVKDIILDPGFGFNKDVDENFAILHDLDELEVFNLPILAGMSRKRMVWQALNITADDALNGTTVVDTLALTKGSDILRVHDVKEAVQCVELVSRFNNKTK